MTCLSVTVPAHPAAAHTAPDLPAPALLAPTLRRWWAARSDRAATRRALSEIPESLRRDVGVDGALPLARFENGGRTFISHGRPDSTLSGWHW
ncbi:hypothetical protein [Paracoccus luteus]|uniref:hypothetical protein n=1 Tax=Paracoccus luteus TaxID=2508543 RepID=UPI00106F3093|nr:hypothetical protein [Paracoccus luteus]